MQATRSSSRRSRAAAREASRQSVVIYCRVSTDEQVTSGLGLGAQESECRAYAARHGLTVIAVVVEPEAISGKVDPLSRPGFRKAVALLDDAEAGSLLVRRQDRVSRRLRHFLEVLDYAAQQGWTLCTTDGRIDTSSAAGNLQTNVMASVAQYERDVISERTREALAAKRERGQRLGRPSQLTPQLCERVLTLRQEGWTYQSIAALLNSEGLPTARGGTWGVSSIQSALATAKLNARAKSAG